MNLKLTLLTLLVAQAAQATTFAPRPFATTFKNTPNFVRGFVGTSRVDSGIDSGGTKRVYTYYSLEISDVFKGALSQGAVIQVREFGGVKSGVGVEKSGAAHFDQGEDVAVTLGVRNSDGSYDLLGMSAGKYQIKKDENGVEYLVGGVDEDPTAGNPKKWTLDAVRDMATSGGGASQASRASTPAQASDVASPKPQGLNSPASLQKPEIIDQKSNTGSGLRALLGLLVAVLIAFALKRRP